VNQSILSKSLIPTLKGISPKLWLDAADPSSLLSSVKPDEVTISGPSSSNSQSFTRIFDGNWGNNNRFYKNLLPNNAFIEWTFNNSNSFRVTKYRLKHKHNVNHPKAFILSGSNDNTNWTEVDNRSSVTWSTTQDEIKSFTVQNPGYYSYYKLNFKERTTSGGSWVEIREIDLIGSYTIPQSVSIREWKDKSGNENHATQTTTDDQPTITTSGMSGKSGLDFDNDKLSIPEIDMVGKTLFAVIQPDTSQIQQILSHSSTNVQLRLSGSNQLQYASASPLYTNETASTGTLANNQISIVSFILNNTLGFSINGTFQDSGVSKGSSGSSTFDQFGTHGASSERFDGKMGEIMIIDSVSSTDRQKVEAYLAYKWGLTGSRWSIERSTSGPDDLTLDLPGAGGKFTKSVPMNDDNWHHLATTFGGGTKKIFVDGQEVASASQSGSVTDSILKLVLGDSNSSGSNQPKIDDVRFYRGILSAAEISAIYNNGTGDVGAPKFAISSPTTIKGAKGKSITYDITADAAYGLTGYNSSITYSLLNAPSWLNVGNTSGTVTGTPPSAGTYSFDVKAVNSLGSNVQTVTLSVYDYSDWQYALPITSDLSNGTTLTDWNMLVRLSETDTNGTGNRGFRYSQVRSNGGDLRFIDNSGSELKYEIARWNPAGESHVWVNIPTLKSDANITMYWGNPNAGLPTYANDGSVWQDYFGVYHLEQTSGPAQDSSPLNNHLTALNTPVLESSGLAGTAYSTTDSANNGFLSNSLSGTNRAKEGTYTGVGQDSR
jgi:hypothetical protein